MIKIILKLNICIRLFNLTSSKKYLLNVKLFNLLCLNLLHLKIHLKYFHRIEEVLNSCKLLNAPCIRCPL